MMDTTTIDTDIHKEIEELGQQVDATIMEQAENAYNLAASYADMQVVKKWAERGPQLLVDALRYSLKKDGRNRQHLLFILAAIWYNEMLDEASKQIYRPNR